MFLFGDMFIVKVNQEITSVLNFDGRMDEIECKREGVNDLLLELVLSPQNVKPRFYFKRVTGYDNDAYKRNREREMIRDPVLFKRKV
jgi:hypothetical protein